jgi:hypothetical protein
MEIYETVKKTYFENIFNVSNFEENIHLAAYAVLSFFTPFMLGHPQLLVGTLVNAALILGATYLRGHKLLPIILLPTFGVLFAGLIFGPFTIFLIYMMPFIWIGNAILAYGHRHLMLKKVNYVFSVGLAALVKAGFLFSCAFILVKLSVIPALFLSTMGLVQLYTALLGGTLAGGVIKARTLLAKKGTA